MFVFYVGGVRKWKVSELYSLDSIIHISVLGIWETVASMKFQLYICLRIYLNIKTNFGPNFILF